MLRKLSTSRKQVCRNDHWALYQPLVTPKYRLRLRKMGSSYLKSVIAYLLINSWLFARYYLTDFSIVGMANRTFICALKLINTNTSFNIFNRMRIGESRKTFSSSICGNVMRWSLTRK